MVIWVNIFKTEKTIEIHLVRLTEVCGKVLSEKYAYKSVKTALLLSNVIDADYQNSCLFTNKRHVSRAKIRKMFLTTDLCHYYQFQVKY